MKSSSTTSNDDANADTGYTWSEIVQQPHLWPTTPGRVADAVERYGLRSILSGKRVVVTGAGTSAYAASAIAAAWPGATAVPSTDLLLDTNRYIAEAEVVVSIGRSGNSPESLATVERIHKLRPEIVQLAITCNSQGALAQSPLIRPIILDPRTDDKSLVMTSSFSNLVLAGYCLADRDVVDAVLATACSNTLLHFNSINEAAERIAATVKTRIVLLCSSPLLPWAQEGGLKALEMTAGRFAVISETFLGLRHGPMSFVTPETVVVCLLSNDPLRRLYECDLVEELRSKGLGYLVGIGATEAESHLFDERIPAILPTAPDALRTPFEIVALQLLGYHLSLGQGLNPDSPSRDGVINRVVQGVKLYDDFAN